jgi:lysophospholipase L1-like esterase
MIITILLMLILLELLLPNTSNISYIVQLHSTNIQPDENTNYIRYENESDRSSPPYYAGRIQNGTVLFHPQFLKLYNTSKKTNYFRIIFIGDSVTYGQGIQKDKIFSALLEKKLNLKNITYEILNFAVCGYNLVQLKVLFAEQVLPFHPDLVIYGYFSNDNQIIGLIRKNGTNINYAYLDTKIPYILDIPFNNFLLTHSKMYRLINNGMISLCKHYNISVPDKYIDTSSQESAYALNSMVKKATAENIAFHIIKLPSPDKYCGTNDFLEEYLSDEYRNKVKIFNLDLYLKLSNSGCEWMIINENNRHYNEQGHKLVADLIYKDLINERLVS